MHVVLRRVSIRTLREPSVALCRLGFSREVDAASFRPALLRPNATRSHRNAGSSQRFNIIYPLSSLCIKRNVLFLCDPNAMQEHS
jgi:hypothetical protein